MIFITPFFELYQNEKGNHLKGDCPRPSRKSQFILINYHGSIALIIWYLLIHQIFDDIPRGNDPH